MWRQAKRVPGTLRLRALKTADSATRLFDAWAFSVLDCCREMEFREEVTIAHIHFRLSILCLRTLISRNVFDQPEVGGDPKRVVLNDYVTDDILEHTLAEKDGRDLLPVKLHQPVVCRHPIVLSVKLNVADHMVGDAGIGFFVKHES